MSAPAVPAAREGHAALAPCPLCGAATGRFWALGRDRFFRVARGSFPLYRCGVCGGIFQHPAPGAELLGGYYPDAYWWHSEPPAGASGLLQRLERLYREAVIRHHVRFVARCAVQPAGRPALLDIGCGAGTFVAAAARSGFTACGMDVAPRAVEVARRGLGLDVRQGGIGAAVWGERRFDIVTLFHVLEHLPDARSALRYAASLLASGGRLVIQVPNAASLQCALFGVRWYGLDVPRHLFNYTPRALERVLADCGLEICRTSHFSLRDNPPALASSLLPWLDPMAARVRRGGRAGGGALAGEIAYLAVVAGMLPLALIESALGRGGSVMVEARAAARTHAPVSC